MEVKAEHVAQVYAQLLTTAREGKTIFYGDLAPMAGITTWGNHAQNYIAHVLGQISEAEHKIAGRPMLTAVVVNKGTNQPGSGFYHLATTLWVFHSTTEIEKQIFWLEELKKVFDTWRQQPAGQS